MPKALLLAIVSGLASAILSLSFFGPAPLIAAGLGLGMAWTPIAGAVAALAVIASAGGISAITYIVSTAVPAAIIARLAMTQVAETPEGTHTYFPTGGILATLTAYGLIILALLLVGVFGVGPQLETAMERTFKHIFSQIYQNTADNPPAAIDQVAKFAGSIATGAFSAATLAVVILNALLAQSFLTKSGHALRPTPSYSVLQLPRWMPAVAIFCGILALLPDLAGKIGVNAIIFLSIPFILVGLTVIHTLARRAGSPGVVLTAFYVSLFLIGGITGLTIPMLGGLAVLGLIEQWAGLRQRFNASANNQEDE